MVMKLKGNNNLKKLLCFKILGLGDGFGPQKAVSNYYYCSTTDNHLKKHDADADVDVTKTKPQPYASSLSFSSVDMLKQVSTYSVFTNNDVNILIKHCCELHGAKKAFSVLASYLKLGFNISDDVYAFATLLDALFQEDRFLEAHLFFNKLVNENICEPNLVIYNTMIQGLCSFGKDIESWIANQRVVDAFKIFRQILSSTVISPDIITYNSLITGFCKLRGWEQASSLLKHMLAHNVPPNVQTFNLLVHSFCTENKLQRVHILLDIMHQRGVPPNTQTYSTLIRYHCLHGHVNKAMSFLHSMLSRDLHPDIPTYCSLLNAFCKNHDVDQAMLLFHQMTPKGLKPDQLTYNTLIKSLFSAAHFGDAHRLFQDMRQQGHMLDHRTYSSIVNNLCNKHRRFEEALSLFLLLGDESNLNSDISIYNDLIQGAAQCGDLDIAMDLFNDLTDKGIEPTESTYILLVSYFCAQGLPDIAKQMFLKMEESDGPPTNHAYSCLLQAYLDSQCYDDVEMLLHKIDEKGYYIDGVASRLRGLVAAGSLDTTMLNLIDKLEREEETDDYLFSFA